MCEVYLTTIITVKKISMNILPLINNYVHIAIHICDNPEIMSHRYQLKVFYFLSSFLECFLLL